MRLVNEEQVEPLLPEIVFDNVCGVISSLEKLPSGQRVSIFGNDTRNQYEGTSILSRLVA
jgi:hypothetical protein